MAALTMSSSKRTTRTPLGRRRAVALSPVALSALALLLSGCSGPPETAEETTNAGQSDVSSDVWKQPSAEQQTIMADGTVTREDLTVKAGFLADCLQDHGFEPTTEGPDPAPGMDGRVRFNALNAQIMASALDGECLIPLELVEKEYAHPDYEGTDGGQE